MMKRLAQLIFLVVMLLALVPFGLPEWKFGNLGDLNVDIAYQLALPYFIEQHLQFGEQVVFTYGPWGILLGRFSGPQFHTFVLMFHMALAVTVFLAFYALAERYSSRAGRAVIWTGAIALVLMWVTGQRDSYFMFPALLVAYQHLAASIAADEGAAWPPAQRRESTLWIVLSLLSGWLALAKFNILVAAGAAYLVILADDVRRRRWPVLPFVFVGASVVAWLGAGQGLLNLPVWVSRSLALSNGYADAMSKGFFLPYDAKLVAVYYGGVGSVALFAVAAAAWHRWRFPALLSLLLTLFLCGVAVKHGMGGNQIEQSLVELASVLWFVGLLFYLPSAQSVGFSFHGWRGFAVCFALVSVLCLTLVAASTNFPIHSFRQTLVNIGSKISLLTYSPFAVFADGWAAQLAQAHRFWQPHNAPAQQTIDVYPQHTAVVIGREGLRYSPRPAFLSLNAHTSSLAILNASYLQGSKAPDLILFNVLPREWAVNNRHPALADGPSWPHLLALYAPESVGDEFLLLKKRPAPLHITKKLLLDVKIAFGESIDLPYGEGNLLWAELEIDRSAAGKIIHQIYKSPHVLLRIHTARHTTHEFQIVPDLGEAGFLISPLVKNNFAFGNLYQAEDGLAESVRSIQIISPDAPEFFWDKNINLKLYALRMQEH